MNKDKKVFVRCLECESIITNGEMCACSGILIDYAGNVRSMEGVHYIVESSKDKKR